MLPSNPVLLQRSIIIAVAALAATSWNQSDKDAAITLSGSDLTVTSSSNDRMVRGIASHSTGKYYYELTRTSGTGIQPGIANATNFLNDWVGDQSNSCGWGGTGAIITGSTTVATINSHANGDTIGLAFDLGAKLFWGKNITQAGNWNNNGSANPATGVAGVDISAISATAPYYPALSCHNGAFSTANFGGSAFAGSLPSGFSIW